MKSNNIFLNNYLFWESFVLKLYRTISPTFAGYELENN